MFRHKHMVVTALVFVMVILGIALIGSLSAEDGEQEAQATYQARYESNRYTQPDDIVPVNGNPLVTLNGYEFVQSNDRLELYVNRDDLSIRIVEKASGYIWGSSFLTEDERLNRTWRARVNSAVWITYFRETNVREEVVEESITTSGLSEIDFSLTDQGFTAYIVMGESKIALRLNVSLTEDGLEVGVPYDSIEETDTTKLGSVRLYPFLGAVKATETVSIPGYTFLPDGSGALARYKPQGVYTHQIYSKPIYGLDRGLYTVEEDDMVNEEPQIHVPVYGVIHGIDQHGFYGFMEEGDASARIVSYMAGRTTDFYWTFFETVYRIQYEQPTSRSMSSVVRTEEEAVPTDTKIVYTFLSGDQANYVGMANDYADRHLAKHDVESPEDIPIRLEFLMSERKKGFLWDSVVDMTHPDDVLSIVDDLLTQGVRCPSVVLRGWTKRGHTAASPSYFPFGQNGYRSLFSALDERDVEVYLSANYSIGYDAASGFSPMTDLALTITKKAISGEMGDFTYRYLHPEATSSIISNDIDDYEKLDINGIALEMLGMQLFSSHERENFTRFDSMETYLAILEVMEQDASFYEANHYVFDDASAIYDMPMYSAQHMKFTDTVPFLSIALRRHVDLFGSFSNFFPNFDAEVLRMIDYGLYPSFVLTEEATEALVDTPSEYLRSTRYIHWRDEILSQYQLMNSVMKDVIDVRLTRREVPEVGIVKNTYDNGIIHYINYKKHDVTIDDTLIPAESVVVIES